MFYHISAKIPLLIILSNNMKGRKPEEAEEEASKTMVFQGCLDSKHTNLMVFHPPSQVENKYQQRLKQITTLKKYLAWLKKQNRSGISRELADTRNKRTFLSGQHQYKFMQKKLVAKYFCNQDYGPNILLKQLGEFKDTLVINEGKYEVIAKSIVTEAVKKLEIFVREDCKLNVKKLSVEEISEIFDDLLMCRERFIPIDSDLFISIIRSIYDLGSILLSQLTATRLYIAIRQKILKNSPQQVTYQTIDVDFEEQRKTGKKQIMLFGDSEIEVIDIEDDSF